MTAPPSISYSWYVLALCALVACGCASDFNGDELPRSSAWEFDERAPPISPAEIPLPIEWHYLDERNAFTTRTLDPWGDDDAYRFPLTITSSLRHRDMPLGPSSPLRRQHFFLGVAEPFFDDGKLHMFEASPNHARPYNAYRFGQLVLSVRPLYDLVGQVLYEDGVEPRTTPYPRRSPEDLPEPLASWVVSGEPAFEVYIYVPSYDRWMWMEVISSSCVGDASIGNPECISPEPPRDYGDHRIVALKTVRYRVLTPDDE